MAPRSNWKGYLKLSLVSAAVAIYPATSTTERVRFNMLNRETGNRLKRQMVDAVTGKEVDSEQQVRGYAVGKDTYVLVEDEELEEIAIESSHTINIEKFVTKASIDDRYRDTAYYIAPEDQVGLEAFAVIRDGMRAKKMVGIARVVMSRRERIMMIEPFGRGLLGTTLHYANEVRAEDGAFEDIPDLDLPKQMVDTEHARQELVVPIGTPLDAESVGQTRLAFLRGDRSQEAPAGTLRKRGRVLGDIVDPYHLRFSPDMKWFVTAANRLNHVDLYHWLPADAARPLKLVKRIEAPRTPSHLAIDSRSSLVYASLQDSDELVAIELATQALRWKIKVGKLPADIYLTPDDRTLLVGMTGDRVVEAWDVSATPPRLVKRIPTGDGAHAFRSMGDRRHVLVSNRVANTISQIDHQALAVVAELPGPGGPDCMELLSDRKTLLVSSRWARKLSFIDLERRQVVRQIEVGRSPHGVWTLDHAARQ